ncbi:MAG: T9SS type A sorting domain-containing protein [Ignavibacteriales bacterium]|nr:T9SS type A sorting domain-containing protein [Ignavibacteriales bacterium]
MKKTLSFILIIFVFVFSQQKILAQEKYPHKHFTRSKSIPPQTHFAPDAYLFSINNITMPFNAEGVLADVVVDGRKGGSFISPDKGFLFSGGFVLGGISNNSLWVNAVASASRVQDYGSGRVLAAESDIPGIYVVDKLDVPFGESWQLWKQAVQLGADFYDGDLDGAYNPLDKNGNGNWDEWEDAPDLIGDQMAWCVYNDNVPNFQRRWTEVHPQGIEIQQTVFGFRGIGGYIANTLFVRYRIINRGTVANTMDSVYFGMWADVDLGGSAGYTDDLVGCDSMRNSGFTWNDGDDPTFGNNPPAAFMSYFQGPVVFIPGETFLDNNGNGQFENETDTPLDTAIEMHFLKGKKNIPGAKNLKMSSMVNYVQSDPVFDPLTSIWARNNLLGLLKDGTKHGPCNDPFGQAIGLPCTSIDSTYWYSGDVTTAPGYGWVYAISSDMRQMQNIGPFTLQKDTQVDIIVAYIVARGTDARNSVAVGKTMYDAIKRVFDDNLLIDAPTPRPPVKPLPQSYALRQNYPNPFNATTTITFAVPDVSGSFLFPKKNEEFVSLKIFDIVDREVATLVNKSMPPGDYEVMWDASNVPSGMYFYRLTAGTFVETRKMVLLK